MKKTFNKLALIILAAISVAYFVGCSDTQNNSGTDKSSLSVSESIEYCPVGICLDRLLDEDEETADIDVFPVRVRRSSASAPYADALSRERPDKVDALRIEDILLALIELTIKTYARFDNLVSGAL